ncbi:MAG: RHS repeat-associated core domain-containing protein, partial [Bacteroidota bacterium]|nr:RHS repeat-associated core domain-containing protein [Bacteroidota bacterium]
PFEGGYRGMSSQPKWSLGSWAYEWNANGSLHKIKRADGKVFTFKYDAFGRRISKSYHRREFLYIWDGNVLLHEIKKDYQLEDQLTTWIFQDFVPVAKLQGDKSYSIISDHIGTPLVAIDNEGVKVWERELDIYGKVRKLQGDKWFMPFLYQGQYYDVETELAYNRFRYYDCNTGSYISQDPIGLAGGNPNIYAYVWDTNTWIDIFGLDIHHLIPNAIAKKYNLNNKTVPGYVQNKSKKGIDKSNLMSLDKPFHGNHPAYNQYVDSEIMAMGDNITADSLHALQDRLREEIKDYEDKYNNEKDETKKENLNEAFKKKCPK